MKTKKLQQIENQINKIKMELHKLGEMRPGSLSRQYKIPKKQIGHYYQLSYTHKMKSRTEYIRSEFVNEIKQQVATYKRFKKLMGKWIDLAIEHSRLKMKLAKSAKSKSVRTAGGKESDTFVLPNPLVSYNLWN